MISPTKTFKRLGIVGAAAVVGLVPIVASGGAAYAASNATLTLGSSAAGTSTTATNTFNTTNSGSTNQIVIGSSASSGTAETLPACVPSTATTPTCTNYTVSYTGGTSAVLAATSATTAGTSETLNLQTAIPSGSAVTVTIDGITNGSAGSVVYLTDTDNTYSAGTVTTHGATAPTNTVTIAAAPPVVTPGVSSVNPTAYMAATAGEPFTLTGTNFAPDNSVAGGLGPNAPVVCFVPSGTATYTPSGSGVSGSSTGGTAVTGCPSTQVAMLTSVTTTQIQGQSPAGLTGGTSYNVVVYNWDPNANNGAGGYTAASGTTSQTLVAASTGLNFVPESGVRVIDSRSGLNLPKGTLGTGAPIAIPLSDFAQSPSMPTNLPGTYTGLSVNATAVAPASGGNIQMWTQSNATACPNGINSTTGQADEPATVNFQPPQDTNNAQLIPVATGANELCIQDNGAAVNLVVDVVGYTTSAYTGTAFGTSRLIDTRPATQKGNLLGPLQSNTVYRANTGLTCTTGVGGTCSTYTTSGGATIVGTMAAFNVAAVAPSAPGNLRVFPEPATGAPTPSGVPNAAVDNYIVNTDGSAMLITVVPPSGYLDVYSAMGGTGTVNVVIDELGSFASTSSAHPLSEPTRIYDSRPGPIPAAGTVTVAGAPSGGGANFVPSGALGLIGNLSDINPAGQGYIVTFPAGGTVPGTASEANFPLQTRNTNNVVALNPSNGSFSIYAGGAATNTTYDVSAYIQ